MDGKSATQWIDLMDTIPGVAKQGEGNLSRGNVPNVSLCVTKVYNGTAAQFVLKCQQFNHVDPPLENCICHVDIFLFGSNQTGVLAVS